MPNTLYDALIAPHKANSKTLLHLKDRPDWSYLDLIETAGRYATLLGSIGAKPGDRVAVQVDKSPEAIALYMACVQQSCVFLPLNTAYTPAEVEYFIGDAKPVLLVGDESAETKLRSIANSHNCQMLTLNSDGGGSFDQQAKPLEPTTTAQPAADDDLAAILYTSGTTGRSKGAMLTCLLYTSPSPRDRG